MFESLPKDVKLEEKALLNSRYDDMVALFGKSFENTI